MTQDEIRAALTSAGHDADRFLSKVRLTATGCLEWTATRDRHGYAKYTMRTNGKRITASMHRWLYETIIGPIPDDLQLDHLCRNRACVNPTHLEPVTRRENILRGTGRTARQHRQTHCNRGHEFTPQNTILWHHHNGQHRKCRTCTNDRRTRRRNQEIEHRNAELYESWHDIAPD